MIITSSSVLFRKPNIRPINISLHTFVNMQRGAIRGVPSNNEPLSLPVNLNCIWSCHTLAINLNNREMHGKYWILDTLAISKLWIRNDLRSLAHEWRMSSACRLKNAYNQFYRQRPASDQPATVNDLQRVNNTCLMHLTTGERLSASE